MSAMASLRDLSNVACIVGVDEKSRVSHRARAFGTFLSDLERT